MMRLRVQELIVVEGKYDAAHLANLVDGLILTTGGFSIFKDAEKQQLIKTLGAQRGVLVLTDSDTAGFKIRHYIEKIAAGAVVKHAYIPPIPGKEGRKAAPGKEGLLGVEGVPAAQLLAAIESACTPLGPRQSEEEITYTSLYKLGLSGGAGAAEKRLAFCKAASLPTHLSKKAFLAVLNRLYTLAELETLVAQCKTEQAPLKEEPHA